MRSSETTSGVEAPGASVPDRAAQVNGLPDPPVRVQSTAWPPGFDSVSRPDELDSPRSITDVERETAPGVTVVPVDPVVVDGSVVDDVVGTDEVEPDDDGALDEDDDPVGAIEDAEVDGPSGDDADGEDEAGPVVVPAEPADGEPADEVDVVSSALVSVVERSEPAVRKAATPMMAATARTRAAVTASRDRTSSPTRVERGGRGKPSPSKGGSWRGAWPREAAVSTASRRSAGAASTGAAPNSAAALNRERVSSHTSQRSTCRATRLRIRTENVPSQPSRMPASSSQSSRPMRATVTAPRLRESRSRMRCTSTWAWLVVTPTAAARSAPDRSWRRLSSMTSWSRSSSPAAAVLTSSASSTRSTSAASARGSLGASISATPGRLKSVGRLRRRRRPRR